MVCVLLIMTHPSPSPTQEKLKVLFMQSDGGLTPMDKCVTPPPYSPVPSTSFPYCRFNGSQAILSGPAGGVVSWGHSLISILSLCSFRLAMQ